MKEEARNQMKELFFNLLDKYEYAEKSYIDSYSTNINNDLFILKAEIKDLVTNFNSIIYL